MSNFSSLSLVTESLLGTAPSRFAASTPDSLATMLAAGYLNDIQKKIKAADRFDVNYADASIFPLSTGQASVFGSFSVQYDPILGNWNLIPLSVPSSVISGYGVHSALFNNGGGSATTTINDASINANSVIIARWLSSANAVVVETVLPGNGTLTIVSSADPGASVLEYISIIPSVALQNLGVLAAQYSYAGGATSIVIPAPNVVAGMVVQANFVSQTNAAKIDSVLAGNGTITVVVNTNPGASVISYFATTPSSALTANGFYAAQYTNAGGNATTTITDAAITANSVVVADWASQTNAVQIEKVTPANGSLTILSSGDPGASVLNYSATPTVEGAENNAPYLPLAGGQMTGSMLANKGTGTVSTGAVTINKQAGVVTTGSLTTAATASTTITFNNSAIQSNSVILVSLMGGTNTIPGVQLSCVYVSAGIASLIVTNNNVAGSALNGTLLIGFIVL